MPVSFFSITSRLESIGRVISSRKGPTVVSLGSVDARRDAWNACCSPSRTMLNPQSRMPRFGYSAMAMPM